MSGGNYYYKNGLQMVLAMNVWRYFKNGEMELKDGYLVQEFKAHAQINTYFPWITEDPSEMQPDFTAVLLNKKATDLLHNSTDIFKYSSSFTTVIKLMSVFCTITKFCLS